MTTSGATAVRRLGRYHLAESLGGGPTGEVFRAKVYGVAGFERQFAVKRLHADLVRHPEVAARIAAAARSYGSLEHPRIARLHEFGVAGGETFTATELVQGLDLARLTAACANNGQEMDLAAAALITSQAARAIGYGHGRGIAHLGVAPTNILVVADGEVKVTDFGLLPPRLGPDPGADLTLAARVPYLAPEQLAGEALSPATDVFQLGVVAWELISGSRPFLGKNQEQTVRRILAAQLEPGEMPKPVLRVLARALARSPFERFPDAGALADALDAAVRAMGQQAGRVELAALARGAQARLTEMKEQETSGSVMFPLPAPPMSLLAAGGASSAGESAQTRAADGPRAPSAPEIEGGTTTVHAPRQALLRDSDPPAARARHDRPTVPSPVVQGAAPATGAVAQGKRGRSAEAFAPTVHGMEPIAGPATRSGPISAPPPPVPARRSGVQGTVRTPTGALPQVGGAPAVPGPAASGPVVSGPAASRPTLSGPPVSGPEVPGRAASGPELARPPVPGPPVPGPPLAGPTLSGSPVSGPAGADAPEPARVSLDRLDTVQDTPGGGDGAGATTGEAAMARGTPVPATVPDGSGLASGTSDLPPGDDDDLLALQADPRRARRVALLAGACGLLAAGGVGLLLRSGPSAPVSSPRPAAARAAPSRPPRPAAVPSPEPPAPATARAEPAVPATRTGPPSMPPVAEKPSAPPGGTGKITIQTTPPGAKIYVDGTLIGKSPQIIDADDSHRVAVIMPGYRLVLLEVDARTGTQRLALEEVTPTGGPGGIKVRCRDKNRYYVFVDGRDVGQLCPTERIGVEIGQHVVEIYDPETDSRRQFPVDVQETRNSVRVRVD